MLDHIATALIDLIVAVAWVEGRIGWALYWAGYEVWPAAVMTVLGAVLTVAARPIKRSAR